ncbi:hypothetical protein ACPW96_20230 [Micromonospora sp. DT81.3]|uniref:hypothetical protein n=1 Tax=Micromonospora sp. DT81.3 TaxID=3416523 RepID=UPI003CEDD913
MNDIVRYLYPAIGFKYELLHTKSNEVRYGDGLTAGTIADTRSLADAVLDEFARMSLIPPR